MPKKSSICILSTGGTISMQKTDKGYAPAPGYLQTALETIPECHNPDMPHYVIHEFENPIDSANMTLAYWDKIAKHIQQYYSQFDGFVILHGTDTMSYTASALSFMFENLNKPVILTGSQLPLFETRNDARENLINALWIAGNYVIPEVCIYFNNKLFRGNRTQKIDAVSFDAFASPNYPTLGKVATEIRIRRELLLHVSSGAFHIQTFKPLRLNLLRLFPGLELNLIQQSLQPLQALVLQTYGVGNAPCAPEFLKIMRDAVERGVIIINCSQCSYAKIKVSNYVVGSALSNVGVVSGGDMTPEAALAKLFFLFSKNLPLYEIKKCMQENLRGELTI